MSPVIATIWEGLESVVFWEEVCHEDRLSGFKKNKPVHPPSSPFLFSDLPPPLLPSLPFHVPPVPLPFLPLPISVCLSLSLFSSFSLPYACG